jgi:hypothetical protein
VNGKRGTGANADASAAEGNGARDAERTVESGVEDAERSEAVSADRAATDDPQDRTEDDPIELGVELLRKFEGRELSIAAAVDRIETITTDPAITRSVLDEAERRGVIERDEGVFRTRGEAFVRHESEVIAKEGEFSCRRCGAGLSTGHFLQLEAGEHGPFGSSCIRKVTGRERE